VSDLDIALSAIDLLHFDIFFNLWHMRKKRGIYWSLAFLLVFILTQDYLFVDWESSPQFLGFPNWLFWFAGLHVLLMVVFYWFSNKYWRE